MTRLILPDARIIHCKRDPIDTCLSCFKHFLRKEQYFAYDLVELGRYYKLDEDLMDHWSDLFPGQILDVVHEDVVSSEEAQTRCLLEFCGLDWDEACVVSHETRRPVRTASTVQIRRPVYRSSIRRWQSYENQLQPLFEALR